MREMRAAVITGATGMIGMALTQYLLTQGITVSACVRPGSARTERLRGLQAEYSQSRLHIVEADLEELHAEAVYQELDRTAGRADAFFHLGWSGTFGAAARNEIPLQYSNIGYTLDAARLAERLGCRVFVGAGSQAEYGRVPDGQKLSARTPVFPENGYGMAKLAAGQMSRILCEKQGMCHIWVRILSVYGAWDTEGTMVMSAIDTLLSGGRPVFSPGEQLWDYLYAKDAARALYLAAKSGRSGSIYPLGSGKARPLKDYITEIRETVRPSAELGIGELPYAQRQVMYLCADIEELTRDTGFVPEYTFEEGIRETAAWRMERKNEENQCSNTML